MARRFGGIRFIEEWKYRVEHNMDDVYFKLKNSLDLIEFKLMFLHSQFKKKFPQKTQKIFVGSMSEIRFWEREWLLKVFKKIEGYPQHIFQFLTKYPKVYDSYIFPKNCWLGVTIVEGIDSIEWMRFKMSYPDNLKFISLEPLIKQAIAKENSKADLKGIDWVILGAETGKRRGKIIPKKEWVENIIDYCRKDKIPVYLKDSLKEIYPKEIKEFPKIN